LNDSNTRHQVKDNVYMIMPQSLHVFKTQSVAHCAVEAHNILGT